jgi:diguanylate cyclase (GGDEF)-like protein
MVYRSIPGRLLVAVVLLASCGALRAQRFSFQRYGEAQGLTNLVITDLIQDQQGYIWAATFNGLFRYDGTSFKRFGEKEGIATTESLYLVETPSRDLWAVSEDALFRLEGKHFHEYPLPVHLRNGPQSVVWEEKSSRFLLATDNGLATASFQSGQLRAPVVDPSAGKAPVFAVYEAPNGSVWYTVPSGICRSKGAKATCFGPREGIPKDTWSAIRMDRNGDLWVRSEKQLRVLRAGGTHFVDGGSSLPPSEGSGVLSLDREGNLFIPTQGGLARMLNGQWKLVTMREGLTSSSTRIALEDREGSLWIGHLGAGLERWRGYGSWAGWTNLEGLKDSSILAIEPAAAGDLFLGTDRGLLKFALEKGTARTWLEADGLAGDHVDALAYDRSGNLWVGSSPGGLSYLDTRTGKAHRVFPASGHAKTQEYAAISALAIDAGGSIWAGSSLGVLRFEQSKHAGFQLSVPPETPSIGISGLVVDRADRVWAAGGGRLHVRVNSKWTSLGPAQGLEGVILFVAQSEDGSILALNAAAQAYRLTEREGSWSAARLPPLPAPGHLVPYFIGSDRRNGVWVGTDRGVFELEPGRAGWQWRDEDDGLIWDDTNIGAFQRGQGNDVWIGTSGGLAHYTPSNLDRPSVPPATLISSLQVNGQTVDPAAALKWRYPVASVQLRVTALTFLNDSGTRFLYRRRGVDKDWLTTDSRVIMYTDLKPGTYTFDVLAESADGVMGTEPATVVLTVLPPWYLTTSFLVLSAATIFLLAFVGYRRRIGQFVLRHSELESAVAARTTELEAERTLERNQHRVLEMIASGSSLELVFEGITALIRSRHGNIECSIHQGASPMEQPAPGFVRRLIHASSSEVLGWLDFNSTASIPEQGDLERTLRIAIRLASIAIENASAQQKLSYQANHDSLTGLSNRLRFRVSLQEALADAPNAGGGFALLFIDLDYFKQINDRFGHRIGDLYLKEVANRFRSCVRKVDLLARIGGDEFAIILFGADAAAAERIVNALHRSLATRMIIEGFEFHPRASIGFSLYPDTAKDAESLLRAADEAMYVAKLARRSA